MDGLYRYLDLQRHQGNIVPLSTPTKDRTNTATLPSYFTYAVQSSDPSHYLSLKYLTTFSTQPLITSHTKPPSAHINLCPYLATHPDIPPTHTIFFIPQRNAVHPHPSRAHKNMYIHTHLNEEKDPWYKHTEWK